MALHSIYSVKVILKPSSSPISYNFLATATSPPDNLFTVADCKIHLPATVFSGSWTTKNLVPFDWTNVLFLSSPTAFVKNDCSVGLYNFLCSFVKLLLLHLYHFYHLH